MKKYLSFLISIFVSLNLYAYYTAENFIDFLVHSNQLRVRTDRLGVLHGTDNIRVAVGLTSANSLSDIILHNIENVQQTNAVISFVPSVLAGIGYEAYFWGIGAGYEFTYKNDAYMVHTPVITFAAFNDAFRINVPVSIGIGSKSKALETDLRGSYVVSTAIEGRYYFDREIPALSHLRFYFNYGNAYIENVKDNKQYIRQQSVGAQIRIYFKIETENVFIEPILRVQYDQALGSTIKGNVIDNAKVFDNFNITAKGFNPYWPQSGAGTASGGHGDPDSGAGMQGGFIASIPGSFYAVEPYRIGIAMPVGFTAASLDENIRFYLEPALSLTMINAKHIYTSASAVAKRTVPFFALGYVVYGEIYIRPVKNLEWYFEIQTGGVSIADSMKNWANTSLIFNGATGLTYYFN
ncbi:cell surface protein [uncultured Brachyspira sp.]|uniref:cell surface protein n=1 Tax=uncultured Brachyspira sp. TaxID=221953 RepID=UPI0025F721C2|nr:cell surface protein [uncultured Brachyspira sp.]